MKKEMFEISVYTEDGAIYIDGRAPGEDGSSYTRVSFHPDQTDILVQWLKEAKQSYWKISCNLVLFRKAFLLSQRCRIRT